MHIFRSAARAAAKARRNRTEILSGCDARQAALPVSPQRSRSPPLFHHSDRRMQERLHGLNQPPAGADRPGAAMSGTVRRVVPFSSEADRSNGGTLASPLSRPSVCLALAGRNLPPLCSPPRRRAGLLAMSQNERAYANYSRLIYSPLEHMDGVRRS